ncbi:MAG: transcription antitermination protein NusB [Erysipelotrichales bacterium]|nr:transcription antitermination protein NusB [Erysipelotrichales bacterium]
MSTSRNANQEKAMTIIYDALTYDDMGLNYDIRELIGNVLDEDYEDSDLYVKEVVIKALLHKEEIISAIEPKLNKWKFNRLTRLAQAILLLSYAHFYYVKDVDKAIVIDIAVHLAKKFLDDGDYKFINAVLDSVL